MGFEHATPEGSCIAVPLTQPSFLACLYSFSSSFGVAYKLEESLIESSLFLIFFVLAEAIFGGNNI